MVRYPIQDIFNDVLINLKKGGTVIIQAPPGAGKSTILPLHLLEQPEFNNKKIIMLEPRRLAAKSVASRMSQLLNDELGKTIGYRVRFESKVSNQTKLEVVTEGILTRLIQSDNVLEDYGIIIFDEFHERSLNADLALALSLQIQQLLRPDLKILIMSATLDGEKISSKLNQAPIITSLGKQFPIEYKYYLADHNKPIVAQVASLTKKAFYENNGDVLVFLPGSGEINRVYDLLSNEEIAAEILKLYGDLNFQEQQRAILPNKEGKRKIILATSIAETSLTIEGIKVVVDSGLSRVPKFDPRSGLTKLETIKVTKDSADQRAGRAGRLSPGVCYRLWSEHQTKLLQPTRKPEILESDLVPLMLELFSWGIQSIDELTWIDQPTKAAVTSAIELLNELEAVENNKITARGKLMADLPTHPRLAHMLLAAKEISETALLIACDIAALLEERDPLSDEGADLELRIELLQRYRSNEKTSDRFTLERIDRLSFSWRKYFNLTGKNISISSKDIHQYTGHLIAQAYPERIAKRFNPNSNSYKLANGRVMRLDSNDPLNHFEWLAVAHADLGKNEGKIFLAAPLNTNDLTNLQKEIGIVRWDEEKELVIASKEIRIGGLVLKSKPQELPNQDKVNEIIFEQIRLQGLKSFGWDETEENLQARILSLRNWQPDQQWPDVSNEKLLETLSQWLSPFLNNLYKKSELLKLDWSAALKSILSWEQQNQIGELAPARIEVPSGSNIKINYYADGRPPELPVRLQELFGLPDTPTICNGKIKLMIHLLSPAYRPVQVTQDLKNFWNNTYHEVRKELRTRYPKHSWPEDPWNAVAIRGVKKK